jgi:hypothetical protein
MSAGGYRAQENTVEYTEREGEDGVFFSIHDFLFGDLRHWGHVGFVGVQRGGKEGRWMEWRAGRGGGSQSKLVFALI